MRLLPIPLSAGAFLLAILSAPTVVAGQQSTTRGFVLGLHASGASLSVEGEDGNDAGGGGLFVGYGLNRQFTLFLQADGAQFDGQQVSREHPLADRDVLELSF